MSANAHGYRYPTILKLINKIRYEINVDIVRVELNQIDDKSKRKQN